MLNRRRQLFTNERPLEFQVSFSPVQDHQQICKVDKTIKHPDEVQQDGNLHCWKRAHSRETKKLPYYN